MLKLRELRKIDFKAGFAIVESTSEGISGVGNKNFVWFRLVNWYPKLSSSCWCRRSFVAAALDWIHCKLIGGRESLRQIEEDSRGGYRERSRESEMMIVTTGVKVRRGRRKWGSHSHFRGTKTEQKLRWRRDNASRNSWRGLTVDNQTILYSFDLCWVKIMTVKKGNRVIMFFKKNKVTR